MKSPELEPVPPSKEEIVEYAGQLYECYCEAVGGVAYDGKPLPNWQEFYSDPSKKKQSNGWIAVAEYVLGV